MILNSLESSCQLCPVQSSAALRGLATEDCGEGDGGLAVQRRTNPEGSESRLIA